MRHVHDAMTEVPQRGDRETFITYKMLRDRGRCPVCKGRFGETCVRVVDEESMRNFLCGDRCANAFQVREAFQREANQGITIFTETAPAVMHFKDSSEDE